MVGIVVGYVYDRDGYHGEGQYFEGTMMNIASFIMNNRWNDTVITDELDNLVAKSFIGGFLDRVDPEIRESLLKELIPMQMGEKEPVEIQFYPEEIVMESEAFYS